MPARKGVITEAMVANLTAYLLEHWRVNHLAVNPNGAFLRCMSLFQTFENLGSSENLYMPVSDIIEAFHVGQNSPSGVGP